MQATKTAIVTGANGFIGAYLVRALLRRGWCVYALGRSKGRTAWPDRLRAALAGGIADDKMPDTSRLICLEADLLAGDLGLSRKIKLAGDAGALLIHLAADTRFVCPDAAEQRRANAEATLNTVRVLQPLLSQVLHVSTAYVAGDRTGLIREEEAELPRGYHNNYEKTKAEAEAELRALCRERRLPLSVARPSIIVNDSASGWSSSFTHLNVMVEVVNRLQEYYGIKDGQAVSRAIRVVMNPAARPNLAPVDAITTALAQIGESPAAAGKIFHLCHPAPRTNAEMLRLITEVFGVTDKLRLDYVYEMTRPLSRTEEMIARSLKLYLPYLNDLKIFEVANTRKIVPNYDSLFPELGVDYLRKVVALERSQRQT